MLSGFWCNMMITVHQHTVVEVHVYCIATHVAIITNVALKFRHGWFSRMCYFRKRVLFKKNLGLKFPSKASHMNRNRYSYVPNLFGESLVCCR